MKKILIPFMNPKDWRKELSLAPTRVPNGENFRYVAPHIIGTDDFGEEMWSFPEIEVTLRPTLKDTPV